MELQENPFTALSLIAAPAVLTNACSVLALGTSNRLARTVDRARQLAIELEQQTEPGSQIGRTALQELSFVQRRTLLLIRALRDLYAAVGSFSAAALISLIGAITTPAAPEFVARAIEIVAVGIGAIAVGSLVRGALVLVQETRLAVRAIEERVALAQTKFTGLK